MHNLRKRKCFDLAQWENTATYPYHEVETIVDKRFNDATKSLQYLVKWEGFNNGHNTWEPESSLLEDVPEMVIDYNSKLDSVLAARKNDAGFTYNIQKGDKANVSKKPRIEKIISKSVSCS